MHKSSGIKMMPTNPIKFSSKMKTDQLSPDRFNCGTKSIEMQHRHRRADSSKINCNTKQANRYLLVCTLISILFQVSHITCQQTVTTAANDGVTGDNSSTTSSLMAINTTATVSSTSPSEITPTALISTQLEGAQMQPINLVLAHDSQSLVSNHTDLTVDSNRGNNQTQTTLMVSPSAPKVVTILRPSIEEVASELSKKYLNLDSGRRNRNANRHPKSSTISDSSARQTAELESNKSITTDAEHDIVQLLTGNINGDLKADSGLANNKSTRQIDELPSDSLRPLSADLFDEQPYSVADIGGSLTSTSNRTSNQPQRQLNIGSGRKLTQARQLPLSSRRRHENLLLNHANNEDSELLHCRQYIQLHGSSQSASYNSETVSNNNMYLNDDIVSRLTNESPVLYNHPTPCSCEVRKHFASGVLAGSLFEYDEYVWLNCDFIQLIGNNNQFHQANQFSGENERNKANNESSNTKNELYNVANPSRFSQRDSGLQTLFAQKFHYLQLNRLKSIDLSDNRLRTIKMDAFHGLENTLEYLNLANNFLGDTRPTFATDTSGPDSRPAQTNQRRRQKQQQPTQPAPGRTNGKSIFSSDELNRLKHLKWLSLQNNQIIQLSPQIFVRQLSASSANSNAIHFKSNQDHLSALNDGTKLYNHQQKQQDDIIHSELIHLDLSDNLLQSVPSESIQYLNKLKILKLNRNRIGQLNQQARFPSSIELLDLSENVITIVRNFDLVDLTNLIELNLSNNLLKQLDQTAFVSLAPVVPNGPSPMQTYESDEALLSNNKNYGASVADGGQLLANEATNVGTYSKFDQSQIFGSDNGQQHRNLLTFNKELHNLRRRRDTQENVVHTTDDLELNEAENINVEKVESSSDVDNLEMEESNLAMVKERFRNNNQQPTIGEELNSLPSQPGNSASLVRLNLSYNFLEVIPGDSLVKFTNLQQLDLSFNRIRELDSNYLCSIYNLVESLRILNIGGNLLELGKQTYLNPTNEGQNTDLNHKQLNKYFGCMQKLEKLILSTNRLTTSTSFKRQRSHLSPSSELDIESDMLQSDESELSAVFSSNSAQTKSSNELSIKFGDNFGNKNLNTLDLSDNKLKEMPIIEQVVQPLALSPTTNLSHLKANETRTTLAPNQTQLNQWISSRIYLEVLNLNYNQLERLNEREFEHLFNLRQLHLDFNKLTVLPVKLLRRFTSLDRLSLAGNRITTLGPLNELLERSARTLRCLNLANNRLMEWPQLSRPVASIADYGDQHFETKKLTHVDHDSKQMSLLEFALEELNLEGNRLTSFNVTSLFDQLIHMKSLRKLNLNYNLLNRIKSEWFKFANKNLQKLLLNGNKINSIDLGSFALNQVNELTSLELDFNLLKELKRKTFDSMPKLRELKLANNLIHTINSETFYQMGSLKILNLNNNRLTSWKCEYFSHLCNSISGNINVDLASLSSLQQHQTITANLSSATTLGLASIPSPTVSSLIELDLSYNSLSQLRANSISVHTKLLRLNLAHNKLSFIPHDLFKANTLAPNGRQVYLVSSLKYLNLEHNRIQTIDNVNFRPLKNLIALDLSHNELQTLGMDVVSMDSGASDNNNNNNINNNQHYLANKHSIVSNNLTTLLVDEEDVPLQQQNLNTSRILHQQRSSRSLVSASSWPGLGKLRHLNLAFNQLTLVNQSLLSELSPFVLLNLNLSNNYLETESLPRGFYAKLTLNQNPNSNGGGDTNNVHNYDLVYTLKLESLDLSHNRLDAYPSSLLDNHYSSMEACNLSHNRIQTLPPNSNSMIHLKSINFEFNPLSRESSELLLFEQRNVRYLNLAATRLYAIQQTTASTQTNPLITYTNAQMKNRLINQTAQLDLIRSISKPIDAPYLRHLNLSSNQLVWLAANVFERMHSLRTLDLSNNQLTRLHLLNNQLLFVAPTLEYLNIGTNLFTNIDLNDLNQLRVLRHLDLSNLLSLQKLNCRFLAKLTSLKTLRMFNYPQLRHTLTNLLATLIRSSNANQKTILAEKIRQKLRNDLILSTIGQHCFIDSNSLSLTMGTMEDLVPLETSDNNVERLEWFNLEELELELYNNFDYHQSNSSQQVIPNDGKFEVQDELSQLLGPKMKKLTLFGLNLTSLSDTSLLGITSEDFKLKISYTSLSQLPLKQIFASVTKRTKLDLDLRNNNIQTIDMSGLQLLDELQQNAQTISPRNEYPILRLASNPFRCDCHSRPLWLWLNQRWEKVEVPQISDELIGESSSVNSANYYLKMHPFVPQTSDLKCFYPAKLRGKLAQHVNYNDLICKASSNPTSAVATLATTTTTTSQSAPTNQGRSTIGSINKRRPLNDSSVRPSESYYLSSLNNNDANDFDDLLEDEDYLDTNEFGPVRVTRFNRFPPTNNNGTSLYFATNFPSSALSVQPSSIDFANHSSDAANRIGKRNQHSDPNGLSGEPTLSGNSNQQQPEPQQHVANTKYSKHRPNSQQKHTAFNPVTNLANFPFGRGLHAARGGPSSSDGGVPIRRSFLTESDVFILTVTSGSMIIMSLVIVAICLFKSRMDHSDRERMLAYHGKALFPHPMVSKVDLEKILKKNSQVSIKSSSSSGGSNKSSDNSRSTSNSKFSQNQNLDLAGDKSSKLVGQTLGTTTATQAKCSNSAGKKIQRLYASQILVPISQHDMNPILIRAAAPFGVNNFLMRSPTIRRMHGLASDATDWFRGTLRTNSNSNSVGELICRQNKQSHGCLFVDGDNVEIVTASDGFATKSLKISSTKVNKKMQPFKRGQKLTTQPMNEFKGYSLNTGCPLHAFKCIQKLRAASKWHSAHALNENQCSYCSSLLAVYQQTKVQLPHSRMKDFTNSNVKNKQSTVSGKTIEKSISNEHRALKVDSFIGDRALQLNNIKTGPSVITSNCAYTKTSEPLQGSDLRRPVDISRQEKSMQQTRPDEDGVHRRITKPVISKLLEQIQAREKWHQSSDNNECSRAMSNYYSRELPMKSMRTFGGNQANKLIMGSELTVESDARQSLASNSAKCMPTNGLIPSQIPTIDVDGRFAYQSDSQIDSSSAYNGHSVSQMDANGRDGGHNTPSSTVATNQEDIFILVHDSHSRRTSQSSFMNSQVSISANPRPADQLGLHDGPIGHQCTIDVNSLMHDECSRTSSPIAYGFMRSTPSATTLSSTTNSKNPYSIERKSFVFSPEDQPDESNIYQQVMDRFRQTTANRDDVTHCKQTKPLVTDHSIHQDIRNNDNNHRHGDNNSLNESTVEYALIQKNALGEQVARNFSINNPNDSNNCDSDTNQSSNQIIISRL